MTSAKLLPGLGQSALLTFTAVSIHDGMLAGFRAKEALRWLHHVLAPDFSVRTMSWSFQQLERLDVRSMAQRSASSAQMIVIAGSESVPLPAHIERWLDACMFEHRVRRNVLVALPDDENEKPAGEGAFVRSIRHFAGRWQAHVMTGAEFDAAVSPEFVKRRFFASPAPSLHLPPRRSGLEFEAVPRFYGIND